MTNHEKDRHVLAAAVKTGAEIIVTYNLRDFPDSSLAPYSIIAQGPSSFLTSLHDMDPPAVLQTLEEPSRSDRATSVIPAFEASHQRTGFRCNHRIEARRP